jgi:hypothetical protein
MLARGTFEHVLIGPPEERRDLYFISQYPSVSAFVEIILDPVFVGENCRELLGLARRAPPTGGRCWRWSARLRRIGRTAPEHSAKPEGSGAVDK